MTHEEQRLSASLTSKERYVDALIAIVLPEHAIEKTTADPEIYQGNRYRNFFSSHLFALVTATDEQRSEAAARALERMEQRYIMVKD